MKADSTAPSLTDAHAVRERLVEAAIEELCDPSYTILDGLQLVRVAHRAQIPERTARRHFKTEELKQATLERLCDPGYDHAASFGNEEFKYLERVISDRSLDFDETLGQISEWLVEHNKRDHRTHVVMGLAAHGVEDPDIAEAVANLYQVQLAGAHAVVEEFVATHRSVVRARSDWITPYELGLVAVVLAEGFALHARMREAQGRHSPGFDPETPGRAFRAVVASAFEGVDDDMNWVDEFYDRVNSARKNGTAGAVFDDE